MRTVVRIFFYKLYWLYCYEIVSLKTEKQQVGTNKQTMKKKILKKESFDL